MHKGQKLVIFDASRKPALMEEGWALGTFLFWLRKNADGVLGALSWHEALMWLMLRASDHGLISEVQFWGHGTPGRAFINSVPINDHIDILEENDFFMNREGLFWFRTCSTFQDVPGMRFAEQISSMLNCKVAGHTHKIGFPWHSGTHLIHPEGKAHWDKNEGVKKNGKSSSSGLLKPNTIFFLRTSFNHEW